MRFYEYKQSDTSPLKYNLELSPEELEKAKELIMKIIQTVRQKETDNE
jgi:hypothetical protein